MQAVVQVGGALGFLAFQDGLLRGHAPAGAYSWHPFGGWGPGGQIAISDHGFTSTFSNPVLPVLLFAAVAFVLGGRLWRTRLTKQAPSAA